MMESGRSRDQRKLYSLWLCHSVRDSILYLQRPDLNRRLREKDQTSGLSSDFYPVAVGFTVTGLTGQAVTFRLCGGGIRHGQRGSVSFAAWVACITANSFVARLPRADQTAHVISVQVMILLVRAVLLALGIQTSI
jgi:ethanolamine ammonia-lyase small subunit